MMDRLKTKRSTLCATVLATSLILFLGFPGTEVRQIARMSFVYPVMAPRLSSNFGIRKHPVLRAVKHHNGIDLAAPEGAQIRAIQEGVVVFADKYAGYGNLITVKHPTGFTSSYGHCRTMKVHPGQAIKAGQIIGTVGSTGLVTGPHLHFEIRRGGEALDPEKLIPGLALSAEG